MHTLTNFSIAAKGKLSQELLKHGISEFHHAIRFVGSLPWGDITDSRRLEQVITEQKGTTTTKHAFLAQLAMENQVSHIRPVLCAFNMNAGNTEAIEEILDKHCLHAIPEVVCLLKCHHTIFDITSEDMLPTVTIVSDIEISPWQITNFKRRYHLNYIENWLQIEKLKHIGVTDIWRIREECLRVAHKKKPYPTQLCYA